MEDKIEVMLDNKNKSISFVKNRAFDIIALGIVIAMTALSLGVVEMRNITLKGMLDVVLECVPFYLAATMLSVNYYTKGTFVAKTKETFLNAVKYYSEQVAGLTGKHITHLSEFCIQYNDTAIKALKEQLLHSVAITWEVYDKGTETSKPLKVLSKEELETKYGKEIAKVICKCKKLKVKGIHPNILLGNLNNSDYTDLGLNEKQLSKRRTAGFAGTYLISIFTITLIGVKDVLEWGWMGAFLTLFKVLYIACGAYMKFFNGYEDITVIIVNHIYRKTDIIKEFYYWYDETIIKKSEVTCNVSE